MKFKKKIKSQLNSILRLFFHFSQQKITKKKMATPNPRIQALILNSRIKEKLQNEMKKRKKIAETLKSKQFTQLKPSNSSEESSTKSDRESVVLTVSKANEEPPEVDLAIVKIKSLERINEELSEQNKSLKQQLLISQTNTPLILNELAKTKRKLNQLIKQ